MLFSTLTNDVSKIAYIVVNMSADISKSAQGLFQ